MRKIDQLEQMKEACWNLDSTRRDEELRELFRLLGINKRVISSKMVDDFILGLADDKLSKKLDIIQGLLTAASEYYEVGANPASVRYKGRELFGLMYQKSTFWTPNNSREGMELFRFIGLNYTSTELFVKTFKKNAFIILIY